MTVKELRNILNGIQDAEAEFEIRAEGCCGTCNQRIKEIRAMPTVFNYYEISTEGELQGDKMKPFEVIQKEKHVWQEHNFPNTPTWAPILGMVEEIGELSKAFILHDTAEMKDAIGDVIIYMADLCNFTNLNLQELWEDGEANIARADVLHSLQMEIGIVAHSHLKTFQKIRLQEGHEANMKRALGRILWLLQELSEILDSNADEIALTIWQSVKQRDWQKNRATAHETK